MHLLHTGTTVLVSALLFRVITSYSIHYTKLYDGGLNLLSEEHGQTVFKHKYNGLKRYPSYGLYMDVRNITEDNDGRICRITSYNVCYTKLLRTAQNQRLVYWPMLKSGDADMMPSQFNFYLRMLGNAELRSKVYWNHAGACFAEQIENFGLPNPAEFV